MGTEYLRECFRYDYETKKTLCTKCLKTTKLEGRKLIFIQIYIPIEIIFYVGTEITVLS